MNERDRRKPDLPRYTRENQDKSQRKTKRAKRSGNLGVGNNSRVFNEVKRPAGYVFNEVPNAPRPNLGITNLIDTFRANRMGNGGKNQSDRDMNEAAKANQSNPYKVKRRKQTSLIQT